MTDTEFRILGPLEAEAGGTRIPLGPRKQQALLARLLLDAGRTVAVERLLDDLWGADLPETAPKMVQIYVSGLRKVLPAETLETRPPGYVVHVPHDLLDLRRFETLRTQAREALAAGDTAAVHALLDGALALWRGTALGEFTEPFAVAERSRLEEMRLSCEEDRVDAALALGRHGEVVAELEGTTARHPLRERPHAQLMLALYREARQADALAVYQEFRRTLDHELGIEPSTRLRGLQRQVLVQDPALDSPAAATPGLAGALDAPPGRGAELARLRDALARARNGERRLVAITGERGIGKSTLVEAFAAGPCAGGGVRVARGQCHAQRGPGEPYMPVLDALGRLAGGPACDELAEVLSARAPTWLAHLPWLEPGTEAPERGVTRDRMLREMVEAVDVLAAERPLVLVLEDLENSDPSTRDLISALLRRPGMARLLVVVTWSPGRGSAQDGDARELLNELIMQGPAEELPLGGLDAAGLAEALAARFPGRPPPEGLAELLHERTAGNPLFARHLVDHWLAEGTLVGERAGVRLAGDPASLATAVPASVRAWLADLLASLPAADRRLVQTAAVAGAEFDAGPLAAVLGIDAEQADQACAELTRTGLLERRGAGWRFVHALDRDAVYELLPAAVRSSVHDRLGAGLEAGVVTGTPPTEVAWHLLRGRSPDRAAPFLRMAADEALRRRAHQEAVAHLRAALTALRDGAEGPARSRAEVELLSMLGQAVVSLDGWSAPEAEASLQGARKRALELRDNELLVRVLLALATLHEAVGRYALAHDEGQEALRLLDGDPEVRLQAEELLACSLFHQGSFARALDHAERGVRVAGTPGTEGHYESFTSTMGDNAEQACHDWAALSLWFLGRPDAALDRARVAVELAEDPARAYALAPARAQLAVVHQLRREPALALESARETIEAALDRGYAYRVAMGRILAGWARTAMGEATDGIPELLAGLAQSRATGAHMEDPYYLTLLADAHLEAADVDADLAAVAEGLEIAHRERSMFCEPELLRLRAGLLRARGGVDEQVRADLEHACELAQRDGARSLELRAAADLASLWREEGREIDARTRVATIFRSFTEGFTTPDLREAAAILEAGGR